MRFVEKLNGPIAVVGVLAIFLVIDGFLLLRYQQPPLSAGSSAIVDGPTAGTGPAAVEGTTATAETTASEDATERAEETAAVFVHRAAPQNTVANSTYIDQPSANGNPSAILLILRGSRPDGEAYDASPIGVWYDVNRSGRWAIFNQDLAPMPEGATFSVDVSEGPDETAAFVHRAAPVSTTYNETYVDHPSTNENPGGVLSVTPNWNPGGGPGTYNNHPIGVRYDADEERWTILNQDLGPMPEGAAFNVAVSDGAPTTR